MDYINVDPKHLRRISFWGRFLGAVIGIAGVIVAIQGLFTTVIGVIPGLVTLLLAHFIFHSGARANKFLKSERHDVKALDELLNNVSYFLLINGILLITSIIFYIVFFLLTVE
ncbi:DUF5362 family protein [Pseudogracilibacillus auburnensis]|uniref:DUF5362 domain-containing protein n=1 Tax=Pseudogracilibacillus auburnensis TaxID=1494959 RepID=A0A2V3W713_9BACI|nr:DUF5362 family protein [Pseudogracilibacillus auburnensis]MBO1001928.1 hypothetical protein [Pseudogracilibacillus auburnensis]PXW90143.1 hypothetical protein DFR56_10152 [Pseudogracilibacillus auburnensis]